ncbi:kinase-like domain-containing protein [Rhodofomes roseus]|uniref:Kinase-like domain-containing protein n=1 Tax=Rhodofomes roseus TaxID=34475 RepID=A0ABQ8K4S8_9APHY|nr:kinase-like domain-containing protein [Rhodofomes roseus]KAH9831943.1 kinase-like domain-containing protein [Rhodofomes roseus]
MDGTTYVAKRFFNIGGDGAPGRRVSPSQNYQNLYQEVCRAIQGQWFLDEFYKLVRQRDIEVDMSFRFVRPLLAKEVIDDLGSFSLASGVSQADIDSDSEPDKAGAYWLIKPRRAASVRRWSGTMSHPVVAGQKGATMSVLAHFIYGYSNSELVAADLQNGCVLIYHNFLTMLHDTDVNATRRNSGVGDHGQEGIDAFIEQHECNYLCKEMGLVTEGGGSDGD